MKEIIESLRQAREKTEIYLLQNQVIRKAEEVNNRIKELKGIQDNQEEQSLRNAYSIEYHSQLYAAFYATKLEKDKSILAISTAGLGFLITFINFSKALFWRESALLILASICFLWCSLLVVKIFGENATYLIHLATNDDEKVSEKEKNLRRMDSRLTKVFSSGLILSTFLSFSALFSHSTGENVSDTKNDKENGFMIENFCDANLLKKSFSNASSLNPLANLKPETTNQPKQSQQPQQTQEKK